MGELKHFRRGCTTSAFALLLALPLATADADEFKADQVKAGFVLNFSKYTEWPQLAGSELRVCSRP